VNRIVIAQAILDSVGGGNYLEIGVSTGGSFIPIAADRKWGVDPDYKLTKRRLLKYAVFSLLRVKVEELFRMTSDDFFVRKREMLQAHGITVCLVDGLHTYTQSLNDVRNALRYLRSGGVILIHDCNPATETAALPAANIAELIARGIPKWNGEWSGDVWKTIVHLRCLQDDVDAFVLECDTGVGVVTKGVPKVKLSYSESDIAEMDFQFLQEHRKDLLGLEPPAYFQTFLDRHNQELRHDPRNPNEN
jgi:hypothetical protein